MKKWLILLVCLSSGAYAPAAPDGPFEDDYYAEYMDGDYDDLYKYGFRMNNYASVYSDRFVVSLAREYGMPRADLRYYLRKGYSPSDLLFGLELSRRAGRSLRRIMELYYGSPDRNWTVVSIRLGLGPGSPAFGLILDRFRSQCHFWEDYYVRRNPHRHPPLYKHSWSYFRPHAPHGRPARPHLGPFHPGPVRMPRGEQASPPVPGKVRRDSGRKPRTPRKCPSERQPNQCRTSGCSSQNLNFRLSPNVHGLYPASITSEISGVKPVSKPALSDDVAQYSAFVLTSSRGRGLLGPIGRSCAAAEPPHIASKHNRARDTQLDMNAFIIQSFYRSRLSYERAEPRQAVILDRTPVPRSMPTDWPSVGRNPS